MLIFALHRLARAALTLVAGAIVAFVVFRLLPGDPAHVVLGLNATDEQVRHFRAENGLDDSLLRQLGDWFWQLLHLDLGESVVTGLPVTTLLARRVPVSLELILTSALFAVVTALVISLGVLKRRSWFDRFGVVWSIVGLAIPIFWLGILLSLVFGVWLQWLPTSGFVSFTDAPNEAIRFAILPSVTLGLYMSAVLTQFLRGSIASVAEQDYIRAARARGLSGTRILLHHAAKPSLIPFITVLGVLIGAAMGGTIITETIFNYPGFGRLFVQSIQQRDYFVVQAGILVIILAVMICNLVVDLTYGWLDPRIRHGGR